MRIGSLYLYDSENVTGPVSTALGAFSSSYRRNCIQTEHHFESRVRRMSLAAEEIDERGRTSHGQACGVARAGPARRDDPSRRKEDGLSEFRESFAKSACHG